MILALRLAALAIAVVAVIDPAIAFRQRVPLPVDIVLPPAANPGRERASQLRGSIVRALGEAAAVDSSEAPRALIAIADAAVKAPSGVPVFAVSMEDPTVSIVEAASVTALQGQRPSVVATIRAAGVRGKTTEFLLAAPGGARIAKRTQTWTNEDESYEVVLPYAPARSGVDILRLTASTPGVHPAHVDIPVITRDRRPRVFVYEPQPSWAAAFARQAIESDVLFDVQSLVRTSRGVDTRTGGAPGSLSAIHPDDFETIVVGGLDALTTGDTEFLGRFAGDRGGAVVLVPDARIPDRVRAAFALPVLHDKLLERPTTLTLGELRISGSEVLGDSALQTVSLGRGQVIVSTAMDAWRYRGDGNFAPFWRAVLADAAAAAVPKVGVTLDPVLARPGGTVILTVRLRVPRDIRQLTLPDVTASLVLADGSSEPLRMWPGTAAGEYMAHFTPPRAGHYDVRVDVAGEATQDHVLVVNDAATAPSTDRSAELAFLADTSGGAVMSEHDIPQLVARLAALDRPDVDRRVRPMQSAWWIVPFAGLLSAEWAHRRRRGLR